MSHHDENEVRAEDLERAIAEGHIAPWFQPVMCPGGVTMLSAEALPRWDDPVKGVVPAGLFISVAIEHGLLAQISRILLDMSCANFAEWRGRGIAPPTVSVNFTGAELRSDVSIDQVKWALERHGMAPGELAIEIAEGVLTEPGAERNLDTLARLGDLGIPIWLDDFGAGPCDAAAIRRVPFALTKVDRKIVGRLDEDPAMVERLSWLVAEAQALGMKIIAKGVETRPQIDILVKRGCDGQQGFAIARPMAADAFAEWLDLNSWPGDVAQAG